MIAVLFRECCEECPHIRVDYETNSGGVAPLTTVIGCEHMNVCGKYQEAKEPEEAQDITIKGFGHADG